MKYIDQLTKWVGEKSAYLNIALILLICTDVLLRYLLSSSKNWVLELEWHMFALIFLLGSAYALQKDEHVRVDIFYQNYSEVQKAWVNTLGHILFLIPWTLLVIHTSYTYAANSYSFNEASPNPGGLPFRFLIKFAIVLGFVLLLLQGISHIVQNVRIIFKTRPWK